jgi:hypothetical protein
MTYYGNYRPIKRDFLDEVYVSVVEVIEDVDKIVPKMISIGDNKKCMARHESSDKSDGNASFKNLSYDRSIEHDLSVKKSNEYVIV